MMSKGLEAATEVIAEARVEMWVTDPTDQHTLH